MDLKGKALMLKIYCGEEERWQGKSLYHQLVYKLKEAGIAGVTVYRGLMGYGWDRRIHHSRLLEISADLPMILEAVDSREKIEKVLPLVREMVPRGLVITMEVNVEKYGPEEGEKK